MRGAGRSAVALVALALLAGACSGGSGEPSPAPEAGSVAPTDATSVGCSPGRPAEPGVAHRSFDDDGVAREYDLSVPASYDGTAPAPLILDLHGFSSNAAQESALTDFPTQGSERGYVVVTPQALEVDVPLTTGTLTTTFWNIDPTAVRPGFEPAADLGFLSALLDEVGAELCIDAGRQFATGMSNGAGMTMALICGDESRFAAAAPVAGANLVGTCEPGEAVPLLAFHGDADPFVPYEGGRVVGQDYVVVGVEERLGALAEMAGCGPDPVVATPFDDIETRTWGGCPTDFEIVLTTVLGGGHTWPGATLDLPADADAPAGQAEFLEGFDFAAVAGHQTRNIEATGMILDFFDAHAGESS